jgi:hypothetical protein
MCFSYQIKIYIYTCVCVFFQSLVTIHMADRHLMFLFSSGNAATLPGHMLLNPRFSLLLFSGWYRKCNGSLLLKESKLLCDIRQKRSKQSNAYISYFKTSKYECTDKQHSIGHTQFVHTYCSFRPSETPMPSLDAFLRMKLSKSLLCTDTKAGT